MSAPVSPVCGRAWARLSILTASTGPSAGTGSPVNGETNVWAEPVSGAFAGVPGPVSSTATGTAARPMAGRGRRSDHDIPADHQK